jgi:hypothetical protein
MGIAILGDLIHEIGETVRQIIPDPEKQAEFQVRMAELADKADARASALPAGRMEVNREAARHANLFVAGWRPAIGWVCAMTLAWTWMLAPLLNWLAALAGRDLTAPALSAEASYPIILGMLGLGVQRSYEKGRGVATSVGGKVLTPVIAVPGPQPVQSSSPAVSPAAIEEDAPEPAKDRRRIPLPNWLD